MNPKKLSPQDMRLALALTEMELEHDRSTPSRRTWLEVARPDQLPPEGVYRTWLILAGRLGQDPDRCRDDRRLEQGRAGA